MNRVLRISIPAVLAVGIGGAPALAGNDGGMGQGMGGGMMMDDHSAMGAGMGEQHGDMMMQPGAMQRLGLDNEQRERMRELRREHLATRAEHQARMLELREEMHALMAAQRPDPDAVQALHARMGEHHGRMMADRMRMRNAMHDLLTEEQRERMQEMRQRGMGMQGGQGKGHGQRQQGQGEHGHGQQ